MDEQQKAYFLQILKKYRLNEASKEEISFLHAYYNAFEISDDLITDDNEQDYLAVKDNIKRIVDERITPYPKSTVGVKLRSIGVRYAAAAAILIAVSVGGFVLLHQNPKQQFTANAYKGIVPGSNKAMLTLANGTKIVLDDALKGEIAKQAGIVITKTADGQIVYKAIPGQVNSNNEVFQNTVSTPRGGQYKVILPDGTQVWLNAASSITYPTAFAGTERQVTLSGEAYFEVTKNPQMAFLVKSGLQTVRVLGTHFNVNAYTDEAVIKTTLLEGSVRVISGEIQSVIVPGEQAVVGKTGEKIIKHTVNTDKEIAWKNGVFSFENDDIRTVMRQVSRWYNINVVYDDNLPDEKYFGEISRNSSLAEVFKILELNNVKFDVQGKMVKVSYSKQP